MEVWWAGLDALGVWSTNSPSGDSSSSFWSVSEPGGGVLEMEEVPAAGFLLLWRFAVSGGVLCIMITDGRAVLVVLLLDEKIFTWSPAATTSARCRRRRGCSARD